MIRLAASVPLTNALSVSGLLLTPVLEKVKEAPVPDVGVKGSVIVQVMLPGGGLSKVNLLAEHTGEEVPDISVLQGVMVRLSTCIPLTNALSVPGLLLTPVLKKAKEVPEPDVGVKGPDNVHVTTPTGELTKKKLSPL